MIPESLSSVSHVAPVCHHLLPCLSPQPDEGLLAGRDWVLVRSLSPAASQGLARSGWGCKEQPEGMASRRREQEMV